MIGPRIAVTFTLALALLPLLGGAAAGRDVEWCDYGSPPPNDFRFRMTGAPSDTSSTAWLASTTSGTLDLSAEEHDDEVNTLDGGVAKGMRTAIANAPSHDETQGNDRDDDDDGDEDEDDDDDGEDNDD